MTQSNTKKAIDVTKLVPPKNTPFIKPKKYIDDFVFNTLGNITINSSTSCDLDEAVAKMLGWLQGSLRIHPDEIDIKNISLAQMPHLPKLDYSLDDHIEMLLEKAANNFLAANTDPDATEQIKSKTRDAVIDCEDLSAKDLTYKCAINTELAKENKSALKIDVQQSQNENGIFITLDSLNKWAKDKFKISILNEAAEAKDTSRVTIRTPKRIDYLCGVLLEILKDMDNPAPEKVMMALKQKIGVQGSRIIGDIGDGIKWEKSNYKEVELDMNALRGRLANLIVTG